MSLLATRYGANWSSAWGTFDNYTNADGISPAVGCCACGRTTPFTATTARFPLSTARIDITTYSPNTLSATAATATQADYVRRYVGNCIGVGHINTEDECSAAASVLELVDVTANTNTTLAAEVFVDAASNIMPHGCYFRGTSRPDHMP